MNGTPLPVSGQYVYIDHLRIGASVRKLFEEE